MSSSIRNRFFYTLPYLVVVLLIVLTEIGLRLWAPSLETPIVKEVTFDNVEWYQINRGYLAKYFSSGTPLVPEFKESLFRKQKKENTFRIFCLGESSMFGVPYQMTTNIPGLLRKQLRNAYPEKDIEVVNWGAAAINSNAIVDLSKALAEFQPDLICVYMGHNEFYGPEGIGANFFERHFPFFISLKYEIRDLRLVKLLLRLFSGEKNDAPADKNLMRQVSEGAKVTLESDDARWVFENYERNLRELIKFWERNKVAVLVSDVSSNMMFPPFMYVELPSGKEQVVKSNYDAGHYDEALGILETLDQQFPRNAFVQFWLGKTKIALRRWGEARINLAMARDFDLLKFRAPLKINLIIRDVCTQMRVPFISADSLFASLSPNDIPGDQLFWEHLHPNSAGYYAIARTLLQEIIKRKFIPSADSLVARHSIPFHNDELGICWLDLAYGDLSIKHLTSRWPFDNYKRQPAVWDSADGTLQQIALAVYERRMVWDEGCYKTAEYFWRIGRGRDAQTTYEAILDEYPTNYYAHYLLGNLLAKTGDVQAGLYHLNQSVLSKNDYPFARLDAGLLLINEGEFNAAIKILGDALPQTEGKDMKVLRANVLYGLAAANANKNNFDEALGKLDQALALLPKYTDALHLKESILQQKAGKH